MYWKTSFLLVFALILFGCNTSQREGVLIEVEDYLKKPSDYVLVDLGPEDIYLGGHINGAVNIQRAEFENPDSPVKGMSMTKEDMEKLLSSKGIQSDARLILYDRKGGVEASRLWWILKMYGFENARILNGGMDSWKGEVTTEKPVIQGSDFHFTGLEQPDMVIDYEQLEAWRKSGRIVILDNRSKDEFDGVELKNGAAFAGHIPGAKNICYSNTFDFRPERYMKIKTVDDLRNVYSVFASPEDTVVLYCHSGVRSAHTYMVMTELLGYKHVYNYDGSWIEWSHKNMMNQPTAVVLHSNKES
jgi:thiosulfate/3-mercaptopyruvate sulfurtransferase